MLSFKYTSNVCKQQQTVLLQIIIFNAVMLYWYCNMPFSNRGKALIKNVYQFEKYSFQRIGLLVELLKTNCKRKK